MCVWQAWEEGCASSVISSTPSTKQTSAHHLGCERMRPRKRRPKSAVKKILDCCTTAKVPASMRWSETKPSMFMARYIPAGTAILIELLSSQLRRDTSGP